MRISFNFDKPTGEMSRPGLSNQAFFNPNASPSLLFLSLLKAMDSKQLLLQYAFRILARQRYTIAQMEKKLVSKKIGTAEEIQTVMDRLKELQYLDDETFAQLFIEDNLRRKPQGLKLLRNSLVKRGVPTPIIAKAFQQKRIDEIAVAQKAMQKKQKTLTGYSALQQKEKLYRFLLSRGFSTNTIFKVLPDVD